MDLTTVWIISLSILLAFEGSHAVECEASKDREMHMNISSVRNESGDWISTFAARKESSSISSNIDVGVAFKVNECHEKQIVIIQGVLRDFSLTSSPKELTKIVSGERLLFHPNHGTNIAIINDGRTIVKIKDDHGTDGVTITNRPLKDDEIFEVKLERKISKFGNGMGIGVTTNDLRTLSIPGHMNYLKNGIWMIYHSNVYVNATKIKSNYKTNLNDQKVGDRLGIKRTKSGDIHLYVNGVDQGPAASGVPPGVFGVYELYQDAVAATIVDPS